MIHSALYLAGGFLKFDWQELSSLEDKGLFANFSFFHTVPHIVVQKSKDHSTIQSNTTSEVKQHIGPQ